MSEENPTFVKIGIVSPTGEMLDQFRMYKGGEAEEDDDRIEFFGNYVMEEALVMRLKKSWAVLEARSILQRSHILKKVKPNAQKPN